MSSTTLLGLAGAGVAEAGGAERAPRCAVSPPWPAGAGFPLRPGELASGCQESSPTASAGRDRVPCLPEAQGTPRPGSPAPGSGLFQRLPGASRSPQPGSRRRAQVVTGLLRAQPEVTRFSCAPWLRPRGYFGTLLGTLSFLGLFYAYFVCRFFFFFFLCQSRPQRGGITLFSVCSCSRFACFRAAGSRWRRRAARAGPWTPVRVPDEGQRASPAHARPRRRAAPRFQLSLLSGSFGLECWRFWSLSRRCVSFRGTSQTRPLDRHAT